jgi:hypothetical protein
LRSFFLLGYAVFQDDPYPEYIVGMPREYATGTHKDIQKKLCEWHTPLAPDQGLGETIFPDDSTITVVEARVNRSNLRTQYKTNNLFAYDFRIVLCAKYVLGLDKETHLTSSMYTLKKKDGSHLVFSDFPISQDQLELKQFASYAD